MGSLSPILSQINTNWDDPESDPDAQTGEREFERTRRFLHNVMGDVVGVVEDTPLTNPNVRIRYSAFGLPTVVPFFSTADFDDGSGLGVPDGGTSIDDLLSFMSLFSTGNVRADLDGGNYTLVPDGGITIEDLNTFFDLFANGKVSTLDGVRFAYRGYQYDPHLNLYHVRHRVLDPELGRWLQRDPAGFVDGLNLYAYCGSDPFGRWDPHGLAFGDWLNNSWDGLISIVEGFGSGPGKNTQWTNKMSQMYARCIAGRMKDGQTKEQAQCNCSALDPYGGKIALQLAALEDDQANRIGRTRVALALTPVALMLMPAEGAGVIAYTVWGALSGAGLNASEQGISMGLGYQDHYDWRETVWAAAAGGLIGGGAKVAGDAIGSVVSRFARRGASEAAGAAAEAGAARAPRLPQDINVNPTPPPAKPLNRPISRSPSQNAALQDEIQRIRVEGARDIRVNQQQVNASGERVGVNQPDLQYTDVSGNRIYVEYDTTASSRGPGHRQRILSNDPEGTVILRTVD